MEGWLRKKKSKSNMFMSDVRRWFKIQCLEGTEDELALCYFSSNKSREVKGWIFLNDVIEITEDKSLFTVVSPARTMTIEAQTIGEHRLWVCALVQLCPKAKYEGETAGKYRNSDYSDEKPLSRQYDQLDSKYEEKQDRHNRRSSSRENSQDREQDERDRSLGSRNGKDLRMPRGDSREEFHMENDDRRGRGKRQSYDDNSTGSSGSRGRGHRMPNTNDDHRKGNNLNYPDASTAARMHSHISGEHDEKFRRGRPPPPQGSRQSRSREGSNEHIQESSHYDYHRHDNELEPYDLSKASSTLSREERIQISKDNEIRRQYDDGDPNEEKDSDEQNHNVAVVTKRKKPVQPPTRPHPRWNSPSRRSDDGSSDEEKAIPARREFDEDDDMNVGAPDKKKGVTIEEMLNEDPVLTVNLDDSDEEEKVDFKAEKRRYANDAKAQSERDRIENAKSKPPLAPSKGGPPRASTERSAKGGASISSNRNCDIDPDFVNDDWDDTDSPPKPLGKKTVQTGSQADSNWLEEDFDD